MTNLRPYSNLAFVCAFLLILGCGGAVAPSDDTTPRSAGASLPTTSSLSGTMPLAPAIVRGLWIIDEVGLFHGVWGQPVRGGVYSYPNPMSNGCVARIELANQMDYTAWVERAYLLNDDLPDGLRQFGGGTVPVSNRAIVRSFPPGNGIGAVDVIWDGRNDEGVNVADGFYRMIITSPDGGTAHTDILLSRERRDLSQELISE